MTFIQIIMFSLDLLILLSFYYYFYYYNKEAHFYLQMFPLDKLHR